MTRRGFPFLLILLLYVMIITHEEIIPLIPEFECFSAKPYMLFFFSTLRQKSIVLFHVFLIFSIKGLLFYWIQNGIFGITEMDKGCNKMGHS